jgi:sporulation protein YlmC with PRC-barrel domain
MEYLRKVYGKTVFGTMDGEVMKTLKTLMIFINHKHIQILLGVKIKGSLELHHSY